MRHHNSKTVFRELQTNILGHKFIQGFWKDRPDEENPNALEKRCKNHGSFIKKVHIYIIAFSCHVIPQKMCFTSAFVSFYKKKCRDTNIFSILTIV